MCIRYIYKIKHIMERSKVSREEAERISVKKDKLRAGHYFYYTEHKWGDSPNYHLCLDSSVLGIERCVSMIEKLYCDLNQE
ncbi:MAG: cytidylate kinase-like family protein, partial [Lachnospiraceae bacterium]|nr:cytidylate kinase-like family protein [Lachnospiraceae bacterium]